MKHLRITDIARILLCAAGILAGLATIIAAIIFMAENSMNDPGYSRFGADFYTEVYSAVRYAVINLAEMQSAMHFALLIGGLVTSLGFGIRLFGVIGSIQDRKTYIQLLEKLAPQAQSE